MRKATGQPLFWAVLWAIALLQPRCCGGDTEGHVELYTGYGTTEKVLVHGRALEDEPPRAPKGRGSIPGNIIRTLKLLETDELKNRKVLVTCAGRKAEGVTDKEGGFRVWVPSGEEPFRVGRLAVSVVVEVGEGTSTKADGIAIVRPKATPLVIVCDFDDTVCRTGMGSKLKAGWRTLTGGPARMRPVDGMSEFLDALADGAGEPAAPVFYVSAGPVNLHPRIRAFLRMHEFPHGVLMLRNFGRGEGNDSWSVHKYKTKVIGSLLDLFEGSGFILIGDSGEKDPEIYSGLRQKHPDRIKAIMICRLGDDSEKGARLEGMIPFRDGNEALEAARDAGLLPRTPAAE